jgi:single-stranded DNA-specific DHH superfamily exonuclease
VSLYCGNPAGKAQGYRYYHHRPSQPAGGITRRCCDRQSKRNDSDYPFRELSGVGVSYKLVQALYESIGKTDETDNVLDLVALGTSADMMP